MDYLRMLQHMPDMPITTLQPFLLESASPNDVELPPARDSEILACPFKFWSFECFNRHISVGETDDVYIDVVTVYEVSPGNYIFHVLFSKDGEERMIKVDQSLKTDAKLYSYIADMVSSTLNYMGKLKTGTINLCNKKAKVKRKNGTVLIRPRNVIYIHDGTDTDNHMVKEIRDEVNWLEGWHVKAHWRRLKNPKTLGKDRSGNYCVPGLTWVSECTKGNDKDIVKRIRRG